MSAELFAYKKRPSFNEEEYINLKMRVEQSVELIKDFLSIHPQVINSNKPLSEFSKEEIEGVFQDPMMREFYQNNSVESALIYEYWDNHCEKKFLNIEWRNLNLNMAILRDDSGIKGNYSLNDLTDEYGFMSPIDREEAIERILSRGRIRESDLQVLEFLKKFNDNYWFCFY